MKRLLLTLCLLFPVLLVWGQMPYYPFARDSVHWGMLCPRYNFGVTLPFHTYNYDNYQMMGDTLINNYTYYKLYRTQRLIGAIREDSTKKVWFYNMNTNTHSLPYSTKDASDDMPLYTETLLYDFSLTMGDTLYLPFWYHQADTALVVAQYDVWLPPFGLAKEVRMYFPNGSPSFPATVYWLYGIGSLDERAYQFSIGQYDLSDPSTSPYAYPYSRIQSGPLGSITCSSYGLSWFEEYMMLTCFKDSLQYVTVPNPSIYQNYSNCSGQIVTSISTTTPAAPIAPSPNPFHQETRFELDQTYSTLRLQLYNGTGQLVGQQTGSGSSLTLNRGQLPSGLYWYRLYGTEKLLAVGKVVVD